MTNSSPWKIPTINGGFWLGKSSISNWVIYTMAMLVITKMVNHGF